MDKSFRLAAAIAATAAVLVSAPAASAGTRGAHDGPVVSHIKTTVAFDYAAGESAENITVNPDGSTTISMVGITAGKPPKLERISPTGHRTVLVTGQAGDTILGNTRGPDGTVYYNVMSSDASRAGIWALAPGGKPHRIAALPTNSLPNGLAIDPAGRTVYAADSNSGTIWAVPSSGGTATAWLTDAALAPVPSAPQPIGANGLRFHNAALWVSNTNHGTLMRVPVTTAGKPGRIHVVSSHVAGIDDFAFLSTRSDVVVAAVNFRNEVVVVYPDGTARTVLTSADGLNNPTATAIRGRCLYITDAGFSAPNAPKLQQGKINISALLSAAHS
ncbi:hypothetical protein IM697_23040 [Streptomyces ferrugineus]|uniref:SMP-30/Gluconolactonase/LRE-like region domain-containing protein n=1 Tax=Streptomyces ferrugineus TaxID=1413221 RepID=A0A7M2S9V3_9ACTN|nr:SMP-30/gluconolactonase/LRE family protein [Streptomyces ferrugineus]QOV33140.1 hypothetical protein IM697_23040 [Streptomyces ferrugineus]